MTGELSESQIAAISARNGRVMDALCALLGQADGAFVAQRIGVAGPALFMRALDARAGGRAALMALTDAQWARLCSDVAHGDIPVS